MTHKESEQALAWLRGEIEFCYEAKLVFQHDLFEKILIIGVSAENYRVYHYEKIDNSWNGQEIFRHDDILKVLDFTAKYEGYV